MSFRDKAHLLFLFLWGLAFYHFLSPYADVVLATLQQPLPPTRLTWFVEYPDVVLQVVQPGQTMNITYESRYEVYTRLSFLDADQNMTSCHSLNLRTNAIVKSREDYLIPREFSAGYVVYSPTPYLIAGVALGALVGLFLHWLWL